jgi:hypothetical protein
MNTKNKKTNGGFIQLIFLFGIFCVIVWYFKLDIRGYIDSHQELRDSLIGIINWLKSIWKDYLEGAGMFVWNNIIIDLIWKNLAPLISSIGK